MPVAVAQHLDKNSLKIEKDTFVDDDLKEHYSDILYSLSLKNGTPCQLYLLFDHKSYPDKWARLQLLRYMLHNWEQQRKAGKLKGKDHLPLILPVIVYHGKEKWYYDLEFQALYGDNIPKDMLAYLPHFQHLMCDLSTIPDEAIKGRVVMQIAAHLFKHIFDEKLEDALPKIFALLNTLRQKKTALEYIHTTYLYLSHAADIDKPKFVQLLEEATSGRGDDNIMATLAEQWIAEGEAIGEARGEARGIKKGEIKVLLNLLTLKFTSIDDTFRQRVENASSEELARWSERILFAQTIDDVFK